MSEVAIPLTENEGERTAYSVRQRVGLCLGPAVFILVLLLPNPSGMSHAAAAVAAVAFWMGIWWISEAVPIPAASLLPLVLLPLTGAATPAEAASGYANPLIFVFVGGFMIALALERWELHRRIALYIITIVGCSRSRIVLGFMIATAFLSMWISNTATAMLMLPMGLAVVQQIGRLLGKEEAAADPAKAIQEGKSNFGIALMLGIAYAASFGGMATLVGSPPNIVLAGAVQKLLGIDVSFARWMSIGLPLAIAGIAASWLYLTRVAYQVSPAEIPGGLQTIRRELYQLGPLSRPEQTVLTIFTLVALAWITRPWLIAPYLPMIDDAAIAIAGAIALFAVPVSLQRNVFVLDWESARRLPWGIVLLFGGGLALADAFMSSGLSAWMGQALTGLAGLQPLLVLALVVTLVIFLTEVTSNTASATLIMPITASLAVGLLIDPLLLMVPAALAASAAFMLPVATPPNAIVFSSGCVTIQQMCRVGFWLNIGGVVAITLAGFWLLPLLWGL
jgi:solute carrier family 13 (sodium-dependent dicarboxylate transporter), member 2/3/5